MLDFRITLEARNPARRCLRQYRVEAGTDLFGVWVVESPMAASAPPGDRGATSFAMKRRPGIWPGASSSIGPARRIGVAYRIRELIDPEGWAGAVECCLRNANAATSRGLSGRSRREG